MKTLIQKTSEYLETRLELTRLKVINKSSDTGSTFLTYFIIFSVIHLFVLMLSIGLALLLGRLFENAWLGFFVIAGMYMLFGVLIISYLNKPIKRFIQNILVQELLN